MNKQECYEAEKRAAIDAAERALGKDATIPLELAASLLPVLPEWRPWQRKRNARRATR